MHWLPTAAILHNTGIARQGGLLHILTWTLSFFPIYFFSWFRRITENLLYGKQNHDQMIIWISISVKEVFYKYPFLNMKTIYNSS